MSNEKCKINNDVEMAASKKRADLLKEISDELSEQKDPEMAKILADIAAKNAKK